MSVEDTDGESETENRLEKGDRVRFEEGGGTETAKVKALTSGSWVHLTGGRMMRISDLDVVGDGEKTDGEKLVDALSQLSDSQSPDVETWCPNCEQYADFAVLQTVERPEFGVENDLLACPDCPHTTIDQTEWRELGEGDS